MKNTLLLMVVAVLTTYSLGVGASQTPNECHSEGRFKNSRIMGAIEAVTGECIPEMSSDETASLIIETFKSVDVDHLRLTILHSIKKEQKARLRSAFDAELVSSLRAQMNVVSDDVVIDPMTIGPGLVTFDQWYDTGRAVSGKMLALLDAQAKLKLGVYTARAMIQGQEQLKAEVAMFHSRGLYHPSELELPSPTGPELRKMANQK